MAGKRISLPMTIRMALCIWFLVAISLVLFGALFWAKGFADVGVVTLLAASFPAVIVIRVARGSARKVKGYAISSVVLGVLLIYFARLGDEAAQSNEGVDPTTTEMRLAMADTFPTRPLLPSDPWLARVALPVAVWLGKYWFQLLFVAAGVLGGIGDIAYREWRAERQSGSQAMPEAPGQP